MAPLARMVVAAIGQLPQPCRGLPHRRRLRLGLLWRRHARGPGALQSPGDHPPPRQRVAAGDRTSMRGSGQIPRPGWSTSAAAKAGRRSRSLAPTRRAGSSGSTSTTSDRGRAGSCEPMTGVADAVEFRHADAAEAWASVRPGADRRGGPRHVQPGAGPAGNPRGARRRLADRRGRTGGGVVLRAGRRHRALHVWLEHHDRASRTGVRASRRLRPAQ